MYFADIFTGMNAPLCTTGVTTAYIKFVRLLLCLADSRDGYDCIFLQLLVSILIARQPKPLQGLVDLAKGICVQAEVVLGANAQRRFFQGPEERIACANVLSGPIMRDACVVVQKGCVHALFAGLAITQQGGEVQVVAEQAVAVGEILLGRHRVDRSCGHKCANSSQQGDEHSNQEPVLHE
jgi:hypothetical protein